MCQASELVPFGLYAAVLLGSRAVFNSLNRLRVFVVPKYGGLNSSAFGV